MMNFLSQLYWSLQYLGWGHARIVSRQELSIRCAIWDLRDVVRGFEGSIVGGPLDLL